MFLNNITILPFILYLSICYAQSSDMNCSLGTFITCGNSSLYCSYACSWNITSSLCYEIDQYPSIPNASIRDLVAPGTPLAANFLTLSFYGDGITAQGKYVETLVDAIYRSTNTGNVRVINQGFENATLVDLINGYSPIGGHLNPFLPQSNITFEQTLDADRPDFVAVQIGTEDIIQGQYPSCGDRCLNITDFVNLFVDSIIGPIRSRNIAMAIVSVGVIGELTNEGNPLDIILDQFSAAQLDLAIGNGFSFVDARTSESTYDESYNCLNLTSGLLTTDGVRPNARGNINLANLVAGGIIDAFAVAPANKPLPYPYGGRIFMTSLEYPLYSGGIPQLDIECTTEMAGTKSYALMVDLLGCGGQPCRRASRTPWAGDDQLNWPLKPNSFYLGLDNVTAFGFTDSNGLFTFPIYRGLNSDDTCNPLATGMNPDWTTHSGGTCNSWRDNSLFSAALGASCYRDPNLLFTVMGNCTTSRIMCVTS
jgi:hypothetical protein